MGDQAALTLMFVIEGEATGESADWWRHAAEFHECFECGGMTRSVYCTVHPGEGGGYAEMGWCVPCRGRQRGLALVLGGAA